MHRDELIKILKEHRQLIKQVDKIKHTEGWEQCLRYYHLRIQDIEDTLKEQLNLSMTSNSTGFILI
ncbi:MAG TPA: hypothetical protein DHV22_00555 [Xanthomarina gelatinilytica]|uniref:Uncharacterized protein n=1 Tax=Xanthomarina gelatinilytica TaxID=1137281 RepID=A0A3D6BMM6_9FLAO|nr:hypothetical protein [Xanthomarina gelatinilytica]|tara:strand:- start:937 stop:1134 length:198 start_codon:yes stop_codon:yes gene_type:complete